MIGRGCYGRPWFIAQVIDWLRTGRRLPDPPLAEQYAIVLRALRRHAEPLRHRRRACASPASMSAGTRRGCRARPSSAPRSTRPTTVPRVKALIARLLRAADRARERPEPDARAPLRRRRRGLDAGAGARAGMPTPRRCSARLPSPVVALDRGGTRPLRQSGRRAVLRRRRRRAASACARPTSCRRTARSSRWSTRCGSSGGIDRRIRRAARRPALPARTRDDPGRAGRRGARTCVVLTLHERSMADKMDRQLTHRNAARSVTAMAAMLAHEVKNPLSGIRGAAQLLEQDADAAGPRADPADLRRDRPHRRAGRPHGGVLRPAPDRARRGQHPRGAGAGAQGRADPASPGTSRFVEEYDPSLPPVHGDRDLLVQVFLNLVKNAAEAVPGRRAARSC